MKSFKQGKHYKNIQDLLLLSLISYVTRNNMFLLPFILLGKVHLISQGGMKILRGGGLQKFVDTRKRESENLYTSKPTAGGAPRKLNR